MLCRQQAGHILQRRMDFATLYVLYITTKSPITIRYHTIRYDTDCTCRGVPIVAVGMGTPLMAKSFAKEFNFPGKMYTDPKREVYKALSLRRGLRYALLNGKYHM